MYRYSSLNKVPIISAFIDSEGVLRIRGRLNHSALSFQEKHPAILPRRSQLTTLHLEAAHRSTLHGGTQLTLSKLRQSCWIIGGRAHVKTHILRCVPYARQRGIRAQQLMGQLPSSRITPSRAFLHTDVDYAGPVMLKSWKEEAAKLIKDESLHSSA